MLNVIASTTGEVVADSESLVEQLLTNWQAEDGIIAGIAVVAGFVVKVVLPKVTGRTYKEIKEEVDDITDDVVDKVEPVIAKFVAPAVHKEIKLLEDHLKARDTAAWLKHDACHDQINNYLARLAAGQQRIDAQLDTIIEKIGILEGRTGS